MDEIDKNNNIEDSSLYPNAQDIKKQFEELKSRLQTSEISDQPSQKQSINNMISNLERFINGENINIDRANKLLREINSQLDKQKIKLDKSEIIKKDNIKVWKLQDVDISNINNQKEIDQQVKHIADITRDGYNQEVSNDVLDIWEKIPWFKRLVDRAL